MSRPRKLTDEQVRAIRMTWRRQPTIRGLARQYGVRSSAMQKILNYHTYKDVRGA